MRSRGPLREEAGMTLNDVSVVLVRGAWADGSSWAKIIGPLAADGIKVVAAPLPLTSFHDDVAALDRTLERVPPRRQPRAQLYRETFRSRIAHTDRGS